MELNKIVYALNSERRRAIIRLLCEKDMSAPQIHRRLGNKAPRYRQSINKSLELLKEAGLVDKYYNDEKKAIYYRITKKVVTLKLDEMKII